MTKPCFFKIIFDHHILQGKLPIPKKFSTRYGEELPNSVVLKVKDALWKVELRNQDGDLWLQNGWKSFAEHFSLSFGHFVVFKYKGNGLFHVVIFDKSATEIDYPPTCIEVSSMENSGEDTEHDISDNVSPSRKRRGEQPLRSSQRLKRMKTSRIGDSIACRGSNSKQTIAYEKAKSLQNPAIPSFLVEMTPSYINPGYQINVPSSFALIYMRKRQSDVILRTSNGKIWAAKYLSDDRKTRITSSWREFMKDNMLQVGDVCLFELIKGPHISFRVVICRDVEDASRYPSSSGIKVEAKHVSGIKVEAKDVKPKTTEHCCSKNPISKKLTGVNDIQKSRRSQQLKTTTNFVSKYPYFEVRMKPYFFTHCLLCVPPWFVQEHKLQVKENVTLQAAGRSWTVKLIYCCRKKAATLSAGWPVFARENAIRAGETYVFELICRSGIVMKVSKIS